MRTRMAAGAVVAATLLTLTGSTVASANGKDNPPRMKDSPIQMVACALGTALGSLTGGDANCVRDRMDRAREDQRRKGQRKDKLGRGAGRADDMGRANDAGREDGLGTGEMLPRM
ncbi:hypothetical protein ACFC0M_31465 [Streptomyces sp. NPDC056149]|uniref:hypothetical protein n=1 Tax=unclassified Streptomyces TaxID=2593676 RepID=UPI002380FBF1|nr:hypothetical protein [Streptomyces sp. WZ-12]